MLWDVQTVELHVAQGLYDPYAADGEISQQISALHVAHRRHFVTPAVSGMHVWVLRSCIHAVQASMHRIASRGKELA